MSTIFGKIIAGEIPCEKLYESEHVIAFKDVNPVAAVHILIVPKLEIKDFHSIKEDQLFILGEVARAAQSLAEVHGIADGYRLLTNSGVKAGQSVFHLHFHLIAGELKSHVGLG